MNLEEVVKALSYMTKNGISAKEGYDVFSKLIHAVWESGEIFIICL